jgi:hypothetical protein
MLTQSNRNNRNLSREVYNTSKAETVASIFGTEDHNMLPPINKKHTGSVHLPPKSFTYGKPSLRYNQSPYEKEPAETCLNGAFAWEGHQSSKEKETALDFPKLNILSLKNSVIVPKQMREFRKEHDDVRVSPARITHAKGQANQ